MIDIEIGAGLATAIIMVFAAEALLFLGVLVRNGNLHLLNDLFLMDELAELAVLWDLIIRELQAVHAFCIVGALPPKLSLFEYLNQFVFDVVNLNTVLSHFRIHLL